MESIKTGLDIFEVIFLKIRLNSISIDLYETFLNATEFTRIVEKCLFFSEILNDKTFIQSIMSQVTHLENT